MMKRMIKYAASAGVAGLFAFAMVAPSQAAYVHNAAMANADNGYVASSSYAPSAASDHDYARGYGAYDYALGGGASASTRPACAMQGGYGRNTDYASCY